MPTDDAATPPASGGLAGGLRARRTHRRGLRYPLLVGRAQEAQLAPGAERPVACRLSRAGMPVAARP